LWNAVKPPAAVPGVKKPMTPQRLKQRKMIFITLGVMAIAGLGWAVWAYIAAAPQRAKAQFDDSETLMYSGHYAKAVDGFTRALSIYTTAEAYLERGIAHHYLSQDDQALADYDRALQMDPALARAYTARGAISRAHGDVTQAMEEYTKSIQARPNVEAYYERGQLYEKLGQHQKAIDDYDEAITYLRDAPHVYRARAFSKANLGDEEGALADRKLAQSLERR
jgi:tetratricopeptide (TPR) repeat protein